MKRHFTLLLIVGFVLASMLAFSGCSNNDDDDPDPLDVTGTWFIDQASDADMTAELVHSGTTITGTATSIPAYVTKISGFTNAPVGSTNPRTITLDVEYSDSRTSRLTGTVSDNNKSMSGTYTDSDDNTDTWTATRQ